MQFPGLVLCSNGAYFGNMSCNGQSPIRSDNSLNKSAGYTSVDLSNLPIEIIGLNISVIPVTSQEQHAGLGGSLSNLQNRFVIPIPELAGKHVMSAECYNDDSMHYTICKFKAVTDGVVMMPTNMYVECDNHKLYPNVRLFTCRCFYNKCGHGNTITFEEAINFFRTNATLLTPDDIMKLIFWNESRRLLARENHREFERRREEYCTFDNRNHYRMCKLLLEVKRMQDWSTLEKISYAFGCASRQREIRNELTTLVAERERLIERCKTVPYFGRAPSARLVA